MVIRESFPKVMLPSSIDVASCINLALLFEIKLQLAPPSRRASNGGGSLGFEVSGTNTGNRRSPLVSLVIVIVNTLKSSHRQAEPPASVRKEGLED